jgi:hypothetical protein
VSLQGCGVRTRDFVGGDQTQCKPRRTGAWRFGRGPIKKSFASCAKARHQTSQPDLTQAARPRRVEAAILSRHFVVLSLVRPAEDPLILTRGMRTASSMANSRGGVAQSRGLG